MSKIRLDYTNYEKSTPQLVATLRHFWEIKKDDLFIFDFLSVSDYKHIRKTSFPVIGYRENGGVSDILYNNRGAYTDSRKVLVLLTVDDMMEIIHKVMGMLPFPDENPFEVSVKTNSRGTSVSTLTEKIRGLYPTIVSFEGITRVDSMFDLLSYVLKMYPAEGGRIMKSKCSKCQYPLEYTLLYNGLCEHCLLEKAIEAPDIKTYDELWRGIKKIHKRRCEYAGEHGCDFCGITWE